MDPAVAARLVQLFVYHTGERIDFVTAPPGSGKTEAVRTWLDSAGSAADQMWLDAPSAEAVRAVPASVKRPTFVVLDDCQPSTDLVEAVVGAVQRSSPRLVFVLTTTADVPAEMQPLVDDGVVRVTTAADLRSAYAGQS